MSVVECSRQEGLDSVTEKPLYQLDHVDCLLNKTRVFLDGSLYLTQNNVIYVSGPEDDKSIIFEYPALGVHAVCHEPEVFERPCIYCQISDPCIDDEEQGVMFGDPEMEMNDEEPCEVGEEEEEEVGEEESDVFEILFSPKDPAFIDPLFDQISQIQLLHPEPAKDDDDDGMFMTANGLVRVEDHMADLFEKADMEYKSREE
ncbi:hypothetical protein WA538_001780 [Blastocystis sp. DL]